MTGLLSESRRRIGADWFVPVAVAVLAADLVVVGAHLEGAPSLMEVVLVGDLAVVIPAAYLACYRARGRAAVVRALGLACLGIWVAAHVVPPAHQALLTTLTPVRYAGSALVLVVEVRVLYAIWRAAFTGGDASAAAQDVGVPPWLARLMAWEAALGRRAWELARRVWRR